MPARSQPRNVVCRQLRRPRSPAAGSGLGRFDRRRAVARPAQGAGDAGISASRSLPPASCIPALNADIPGTPNCRAINDKVLSLAREIKPDIVLLHGTWEKYLDNVAETVAALKKQTSARVVVLGRCRAWRRGLPNEVLRYFMLHHRLIPQRSDRRGNPTGTSASCATSSCRSGAEFISAWDALCNAEGCLTRVGDSAGDIIGERSGASHRKRLGVPDQFRHRPLARRVSAGALP